ncbi:MAG: hypothetical protein K8S62_14590 [Candidatus Sabulitectum sp.]|nr:hypothetical protein [Candidatus Sabulitectum sp.]
MKYLVSVFAFTALAFANSGYNGISSGISPRNPGSDDITLTLINNWILPNMALGLDVFEGPGQFHVLAVDKDNNLIRVYDAASASPLGTITMNAANNSCFGTAWNNNPDADTYYTNDWINAALFYTEDYGTTWTTETNPAGLNGRGMDFDGTDYWQTNGTGGGLLRFQPGVGAENIAIPEVTEQPSGITVFPCGSNLGIAVTTYMAHNIYFYEWDGSTMSYIGSAACPSSCLFSLGLAYAETTGTLFWCYWDNSFNTHLTELSFTITSLERTSWGSIKSSF